MTMLSLSCILGRISHTEIEPGAKHYQEGHHEPNRVAFDGALGWSKTSGCPKEEHEHALHYAKVSEENLRMLNEP